MRQNRRRAVLFTLLCMMLSTTITKADNDDSLLLEEYVNLRLEILYASTDDFIILDTGRADWNEDEARAEKIEDLCTKLLMLVNKNPELFGTAPDVFAHLHLIDSARIRGMESLESLLKNYQNMVAEEEDPNAQAVWEYCLYACYNNLAGNFYDEADAKEAERKARQHLEACLKLDANFFRAAKDFFEIQAHELEWSTQQTITNTNKILAMFPDNFEAVPDQATYYHLYWRFAYRVSLLHLQNQDFKTAEQQLFKIINDYAPETFDRKKYYHFRFFSVYNDLGVCYMQNNKITQAKAAFEKSLQLNPKNSNALVNLGLLAAEAQDYRNAIRYFNQAAEINQRRSDVHLHLGMCYLEMNDRPNAIRSLQRVLQVDTSNSPAAVHATNLLKQLNVQPSTGGAAPMPQRSEPSERTRTGITDTPRRAAPQQRPGTAPSRQQQRPPRPGAFPGR